MNKKVSSVLKYALWIGVAVILLYFSFRGVNWKDFGDALRYCKWGWVIVSMFLGALAFLVRSFRWRMLITPIDPSTSWVTTFNAYNICMIANLVLPRAGEVVRCGYIVKHSERDKDGKHLVTMDKALGTVVMDRVWDAVSLLVVLAVMVALMWERFGAFFHSDVFAGAGSNLHIGRWVVVILVAGVIFLFLCWLFREKGGVWARVWNFMKGIGDGLKTSFQMENVWLFILLTAIMWVIYWFMSATILWALQGIDTSSMSAEMAASLEQVNQLGMVDALFLMMMGAISSVIPVPGGFGAFHTVVGGALAAVYGIPFEVGLIFATLSHESQVICDTICGAVSYAFETGRKGK